MQKEGTVSFYNHDGMSIFKKLEFREAYCFLYKEEFSSNGKLAMRHTIEISPGNTNYHGINFTKNWSEPVFDTKNANTFVKEEEEDEEKRIVLSFTAEDSDVEEGKFGYDNYKDCKSQCTSDKNKLKQEYKPLQVYGEEYVPAWLSMRKGQTITLKFATSRSKNYKLFNEIKFADHPDFTFEPANLKGVDKVNITCNNTNATTAQIKVEGDGVVVGAVNFFYPEPKKVDLRWIVVNFNEGDTVKIEGNDYKTNQKLIEYFKKAFNPAVVDINIVNEESEILDLTKKIAEIAETENKKITNEEELKNKKIVDKAEIEYVAGIRKHIQDGTKDQAKSEEEERKALMRELKSLHTIRNKGRETQIELTLLLTNLKCQIPVKGSDEKGSNNGITHGGVSLMFFGNRDKFPNKETPHEVMHGTGLPHTFIEDHDKPTSKKHTLEMKATPNVMDYEGDQNRTYYWQWQEIYNSNYSK